MAKLPADPRANQYIASDGQTEFNYTFMIYSNEEILVSKNNTILELTTDYTVTGAKQEGGGMVILNTAAALDDVITLTGDSYVKPETSFIPGGAIIAANLTKTVKKIDDLVSELVTDTKRYVKQKVWDPNIDLSFPLPDSKKCIKWSEAEDSLVNSTYDPDEIPDKTQADVDKCDADVVLCDQAVLDCQAEVVNCQTELTNCEDQVTLASGFADNASDSADAAAISADEAAASAASVDFSAVDKSIKPDLTDTHDLGATDKEWNNVYANNVNSTGTVLVRALKPETTATYALGGPGRRWTNGFIDNVICSTINGAPPVLEIKAAQYTYDVAYSEVGGDSPLRLWTTRPINTEIYDTIGITLTDNVLTLPAGDYKWDLTCVCYYTEHTKCRIMQTSGTPTSLGETVSFGAPNVINQIGKGEGFFTLAAQQTIEVQMIGTKTQAFTGFGAPSNQILLGDNRYLSLILEKI